MQFDVIRDANAVAEKAAEIIVAEAHSAVSAHGRFTFAVSGGQTPWRMLRALSAKEMPWAHVFLFQVDERVVPEGDPKRNLTHLRDSLLQHVPMLPEQICAMPVDLPDLDAGSAADASLDKQAPDEFAEQVSGALRRYIEARFALPVTQRTSEEFLTDLLTRADISPLLAAKRPELGHFLEICDLAKFAARSLHQETMRALISSARSFIDAAEQPTGASS